MARYTVPELTEFTKSAIDADLVQPGHLTDYDDPGGLGERTAGATADLAAAWVGGTS